jgi:pimeloyl-ACP methyl ester carboxylesterase
VPTFASYDGTEIGYHVRGDGQPLVCLPGGPGRTADYLGGLGGLDASRRLVLLDTRGTGLSADPADPATRRVDRLIHDVEALRVHLGLNRMDLLAHSAGAVLATLYAAAYPQRLSRLALITPGLGAVGIEGTQEDLRAIIARRAAEPWYPAAVAALEQILAGSSSMEAFAASRPLFFARWDEAAQAHATLGIDGRTPAARGGFFAGAVIDPAATRAALTKLSVPVLLYAGDMDPLVTPAMVQEAAPLFGGATVAVQPGAGHFPWVDDPAAFTTAVGAFLTLPRGHPCTRVRSHRCL